MLNNGAWGPEINCPADEGSRVGGGGGVRERERGGEGEREGGREGRKGGGGWRIFIDNQEETEGR